MRSRLASNTKGFTLIELLVVMGLMAVLFGLSAINLIRPQNVASLNGTSDTLVADIKSQQLLAVAGDPGTATTAQAHGLYVQSGQYTVFAATTYSAAEASNFVIKLDTSLSLSTTFPSSQVIFSKGSGEVQGFTAGNNTITLANAASGDSRVLTINRFGAVTVN
jgi:prepilin-type N-terminal cleavage/methylation domain-containing protein